MLYLYAIIRDKFVALVCGVAWLLLSLSAQVDNRYQDYQLSRPLPTPSAVVALAISLTSQFSPWRPLGSSTKVTPHAYCDFSIYPE